MSEPQTSTPIEHDASLPRLWGFGWRGVVGLCVLVPLVWALISGVDLRYELQVFVFVRFGWIYGFCVKVLLAYRMAFDLGVVTPVTACWLLVVWHLAPIRNRGLTCVCAVLLSWLVPLAWWNLTYALPWSLTPSFRPFPPGAGKYVVVAIGLDVLMAALAGYAVRSKRVAITLGSVWLVGVFGQMLIRDEDWVSNYAVAIQVVGFGAMLRWALRERWRVRHSHHCRACGYDLVGLAGEVCPECGRSISAPAGTCPSSRPGEEPMRG
ncbi:MAG: hypothetical protein IT434_11330 [Phycisphaerales bacterium]|jgi:hypothetical protein|nr:hypothetical protein [Phycisphaerales bacterium]